MRFQVPPVKTGDELEVEIIGIGKQGDGVAKVDSYVIFIPGVNEGDKVKIKVTKVLPKFAFGEVVGTAAPAETEAPMEEPTESIPEETPAEVEAPAEETPKEEKPAKKPAAKKAAKKPAAEKPAKKETKKKEPAKKKTPAKKKAETSGEVEPMSE